MPTSRNDRLDELNIRILRLMVQGFSNSDIAAELKKPMSTIQRRTRRLVDGGFISMHYRIDYKKFGYKKGFVHIYLSNGNIYDVAEKVRHYENVLSVSIHIGNSDVVAEYATKEVNNLVTLMAEIKSLPSIAKVVWSEEVTFADGAMPLLPEFGEAEKARKR